MCVCTRAMGFCISNLHVIEALSVVSTRLRKRIHSRLCRAFRLLCICRSSRLATQRCWMLQGPGFPFDGNISADGSGELSREMKRLQCETYWCRTVLFEGGHPVRFREKSEVIPFDSNHEVFRKGFSMGIGYDISYKDVWPIENSYWLPLLRKGKRQRMQKLVLLESWGHFRAGALFSACRTLCFHAGAGYCPLAPRKERCFDMFFMKLDI